MRSLNVAAILAVPVVLLAAGCAWENIAIDRFALERGNHDLFQTWVGKDQDDHKYDYRGKNRYYETWAIRIPFAATAAAILIYAFLVTRRLSRGGRPVVVVSLWGAVVASLVALACRTAYVWLENSGVFI
jgi:hypothetical protein